MKTSPYKSRALIMKAMAHQTRLHIIDLLYKGELCVCDIVDTVGGDKSTISKHLTVLRNAGIVEDDKRGLNVFYKLTCPCVVDNLTCIEKVISQKRRNHL